MTPFDPTKPVQTRDGRAARILCTDLRDATYPLVAAYEAENGQKERACRFTRRGGFLDSGEQHPQDLVNVPDTRRLDVWVNLYPDPFLPALHLTRQSADSEAIQNRIACKKITILFDEGEGL